MLPDDVQAALRSPDARFGRYVLVREIGRGGMGSVWKAWQEDLGRYVALKLLSGTDADDRARFLREAQLAARLSHPNIAPVFEAGDVGGRPYIAMQFINGVTIDRLRILLSEKVNLVRQVALALHHAHEQGVVHRDVKPANIMVETDPSLRVYVMDFGLAKSMSVGSSLSMSGVVLGTPSFMPPEQASGDLKRGGPRSDVYSLGATLYHLAAGAPPFESENALDVLLKVRDEEPVPPRRRAPTVPADLETIILKCLEKDPSRRYASCAELAEDLRRFLDGEAILAKPSSAITLLWKRVRRHPARVAAAVAIVLALAAGGAVVSFQLGRSGEFRRYVVDADAAFDSGRLDQAVSFYEAALALRDDARCRLRRDECANRLEEAKIAAREKEGRLRRAQEIVSAQREAIERARLHLYRPAGTTSQLFIEVDDAIRRLEEAVAIEPSIPEAHFLTGLGHEMLGKLPEAHAAYTRALEANPGSAVARAHRARVLFYRSVHYMTAPTGKGPVPEPARAWAGQALRDLAAIDAASLSPGDRRVYDIARTLAQLADLRFEQARDLADAGIEKYRDEECYLVRAMVRSVLGRPDLALADFDEAIRQRAKFFEAYFWRATIQADAAKKLADYDRAIEINPRYPHAYHNRAELSKDLGRFQEAIADFDRAIELEPTLLGPHLDRATLLTALGRFEAAEKGYDRVLELDPKHPLAWAGRGTTRIRMGKFDEAFDDLTRALELNPSMAEAWSNRAYVKAHSNDIEGAIADSSQAIAVDPKNPLPYSSRASYRNSAGDHEGAITDCTKALELDPKYYNAWFNRANARGDLGRIDEAIADYTEALQVRPDGIEALANRGHAYLQKAKYREALDDFQKALEVRPAEAPRLRKWIEEARAGLPEDK